MRSDHNILIQAIGRTPFPAILWAGVIAGIFLLLATANRDEVFVGGSVFFVDADCYSRMTRVAMVMDAPLSPVQRHDFENFPAGVASHTTAPLDYLIAVPAMGFRAFGFEVTDRIGAWISPVLGLAAIGWLWGWSRWMALPYRSAMLFLFAVSPAIVQAFKLGRPDHQSLVLLLLTAGLAAEWSLWSRPGRRIALTWGLAWGGALWVSLYEPLIIFTMLMVVRFVILRRNSLHGVWRTGWVAAAVVLLVGWLVDGFPSLGQEPEVIELFPNWSRQIGELAGLPAWSPALFGWVGWLLVPLPLLLGIRALRERGGISLLLLVLVVGLFALTLWQIRWNAIFAMAVAFAIPAALVVIPWRAAAWSAFVISLFPIASTWDRLLFPDAAGLAAKAERIADNIQLREVAGALRSDETLPVLAPWWLSPPLAYWSGQPCVAGSSHQSLPGIADTARFYLAVDAEDALAIVNHRGVRRVVAYEPSRILATSADLLGQPVPQGTLGERIYTHPGRAPGWLQIEGANAYFRIFSVRERARQTPHGVLESEQ